VRGTLVAGHVCEEGNEFRRRPSVRLLNSTLTVVYKSSFTEKRQQHKTTRQYKHKFIFIYLNQWQRAEATYMPVKSVQ